MRELSRDEDKVLIVVAVGDTTHAAELKSMTTLCSIPLDHPALGYPAMDTGSTTNACGSWRRCEFGTTSGSRPEAHRHRYVSG